MEGVGFGILHMQPGEHVEFGAQQYSWFFQVRRGAMEVRFPDQPAVKVGPGGCIGFDGRRPFSLVETSPRPGGTRPFAGFEPWHEIPGAPLRVMIGRAPITANVLLESFWSIIHVPADPPGQTHVWIAQLVDLIELELSAERESVDRAGVLQRLAELIIFTLVRYMAEKEEPIRENLPMALQDSRIWRALSMFHQSPEADWTVEGLARVAGMSRTALAVRFHELLGEPPLHCLTRLRMDMAADMLLCEDTPIKTIAERVGYGTEAAFNRAFTRHRQISPGRWRSGSHAKTQTGALPHAARSAAIRDN